MKNNVLMISGSSTPVKCGVGYYTERLLEEFNNENVHFLTTKGAGQKKVGKSSIDFVDDWKIGSLKKILKLVKSHDFDIVHIQYPTVGYRRNLGINLVPLFLKLFTRNVKIIVTLHEYHDSALLGKIRNLITVFFANTVIVSNTVDKNRLPRLISRKTTIVPIGSNIDIAKPNKKTYERLIEKAGFDKDEPTIAYFGFPTPNKGLDTLIKSSPHVDSQILLLTELDDSGEYQRKLQDLLGESVRKGAKIYKTGFLQDQELSEVLQECSFFLLPQPSPITAKSGTAIAASIHGLPIVSTASSNTSDNLPYINQKNSVLLDSVNTQTVAQICNKLIEDKNLLADLKAGSLSLKDYFDWSKIVSTHKDLYHSM